MGGGTPRKALPGHPPLAAHRVGGSRLITTAGAHSGGRTCYTAVPADDVPTALATRPAHCPKVCWSGARCTPSAKAHPALGGI